MASWIFSIKKLKLSSLQLVTKDAGCISLIISGTTLDLLESLQHPETGTTPILWQVQMYTNTSTYFLEKDLIWQQEQI